MSAKADFTAVMKILAKGSFPFAVYRLPGEDTVKVLIDRSEDLHVVENANADRGFVFAPFASERVPSVLLRPGAVAEFPMSSLPVAENLPRQMEGVYRWGEEDREHYVELVGRAKDALQQGTLEKVVVSRRVALPCSRVDAAGLFSALAVQYPEAFVYCFSHPRIGRWFGASPELLLLRRGKQLRSMALAGTLPYQGDRMYRWDRKNVEEQAIVSVFIKDALERSGAATVSVSTPGNQSAGPVVHLCSRIEAQATDELDMNTLLRNLAPTPALCGYPRREAMEFIRHYEGYPREFYGGYLGELNLAGEKSAELYVNIRCMQARKGELLLYAGGGILSDSDPVQEWDETERKLSAVAPLAEYFAQD